MIKEIGKRRNGSSAWMCTKCHLVYLSGKPDRCHRCDVTFWRLGDVVYMLTKAIGIPYCNACDERRIAWNRISELFLRYFRRNTVVVYKTVCCGSPPEEILRDRRGKGTIRGYTARTVGSIRSLWVRCGQFVSDLVYYSATRDEGRKSAVRRTEGDSIAYAGNQLAAGENREIAPGYRQSVECFKQPKQLIMVCILLINMVVLVVSFYDTGRAMLDTYVIPPIRPAGTFIVILLTLSELLLYTHTHGRLCAFYEGAIVTSILVLVMGTCTFSNHGLAAIPVSVAMLFTGMIATHVDIWAARQFTVSFGVLMAACVLVSGVEFALPSLLTSISIAAVGFLHKESR